MILSFGKYKGMKLSDIYLRDESYLEWLSDQPWFQLKNPKLYREISEILKEIRPPVAYNEETTVIYTDGACKNNGSKKAGKVRAGIGVHFPSRNKVQIPDVSERLFGHLTNNVAELIAIRKSLELCRDHGIHENIILYTDSGYALKCITAWYPQWVKQNTLKNKKNLEILKDISDLLEIVSVSFKHIKAHTGLKDEHSLGNARADDLANKCL
tara:strand:+ start:26 stop:661 length:636 start_codon:yes stop_codon:yes gene_type:complete